MLEISALHAAYEGSEVLHGIDLALPAGGAAALIGRNGVGKSTLFKAVMNAGPSVRGTIRLGDAALDRQPAYQRARMGIGFVPEDRRIFPQLTVAENLGMARSACGGRMPRTVAELVRLLPVLQGLEGRLGFQLSGGQQQVLALARALVARPRVILLDEPTEGLAPVVVDALADSIVALCRDEGVSLLMAEQNLAFARRCTHHVHFIDAGRIVFSGGWGELDRHPEVVEQHLMV